MANFVDFTNEEEVQELLTNTEIEYMYGCHKEHDPDSCYRLGEFLQTVRKNFTESASVYKKCCEDFSLATCCFKLGQYHMLGKGGVQKDHVRAFEAYSTACAQGKYEDQGKNDRIAAACCNMALLLYNDDDNRREILTHMRDSSPTPESPDPPTAPPVDVWDTVRGGLSRACELNDAHACWLLSATYMRGFERSQPPDPVRASELAGKSCELGNPRACHNLSVMYRRGDGVERDPARAAELAKRRDELVHGSFSLSFGQK